jgi:Leucine-rich repeat (LRR) protein
MGKFIGLYGFDDLFVSVPDTIKQIMITNTNKDSNIAFDIQPSIGRFKNVTALLFSNIVKSIPDEIGNLKNLNFLSLPNNPQLTSLPESLSGCENMTLINLENTPAKLPESLKPKFGETDQDFYWGNQ